jgi:superfamily I DNA and RNA helicase
MDEPYLKSLLARLTPSVLIEESGEVRWQKVTQSTVHTFCPNPAGVESVRAGAARLGDQITQRRAMKPVLSREQQRLTNLSLDGKPRLVRGVVGSGKSIVLCHWLAKTVRRYEAAKDIRIWAVYANRSLHRLLQESVEAAWNEIQQVELFERKQFPWELVSLYHVRDVFNGLLPEAALSMNDFDFDYDRAAEEFLSRHDIDTLLPRCTALFIDEAQDMGPSTIKLLLAMVEKADEADPNSRAAHIFYDNAQNIYQRKTPKWSDLGIDVRGRSTIMRESFRSTTPIAELAVNVLYRLTPENQHDDQHELMAMGLIEKTTRDADPWLRVRFNQLAGPKPTCQIFPQRAAELDAVGNQLRYLIQQERITPADICIIYNSQPIAQRIESELAPKLREIGVELSVQTSRSYERRDNTLIVTTSNSYKGYESEVVFVVGVDQFVTIDEQILASNLYVAMTRARSLLAIYGTTANTPASQRLCEVLLRCTERQQTPVDVDMASSVQDDLSDILHFIGVQHRAWLIDLWKRFEVQQEPIVDASGAVIAEPVFWFVHQERIRACFGEHMPADKALTAGHIQVLVPGDRVE